jgi:hypothetical protein
MFSFMEAGLARGKGPEKKTLLWGGYFPEAAHRPPRAKTLAPGGYGAGRKQV